MRDADIKLDGFGISKNTYRELKYFCLQYPEKKRKLESLLGISSTASNGMPHGSNTSSPTERQAILRDVYNTECEMIETAAKTSTDCTVHYTALMKHVTEGIRYEDLQIYCGRNQFFMMRRKFFYILASLKGKI